MFPSEKERSKRDRKGNCCGPEPLRIAARVFDRGSAQADIREWQRPLPVTGSGTAAVHCDITVTGASENGVEIPAHAAICQEQGLAWDVQGCQIPLALAGASAVEVGRRPRWDSPMPSAASQTPSKSGGELAHHSIAFVSEWAKTPEGPDSAGMFSGCGQGECFGFPVHACPRQLTTTPQCRVKARGDAALSQQCRCCISFG